MKPQTIACIFRNTVPLGVDRAKLIASLSAYAAILAGAWPFACQLIPADKPPPGSWPLIFADDADQAGALGYHDDPDGSGARPPEGFVFVRTSQRYGEP